MGAEIMFRLNFGSGPRAPETGLWEPDNGRRLIEYARSLPQARRFKYREAGNEVNGLFYNYRMHPGFGLEMYSEDIAALRRLLDDVHPEGLLSAPATYFFPLPSVGDPKDFTARTLDLAREHIDIVNWR